MQSPTIIQIAGPTPEQVAGAYHGLPPGQRYPLPAGGQGCQFPALARHGAGL
jgi:hypothetical protein